MRAIIHTIVEPLRAARCGGLLRSRWWAGAAALLLLGPAGETFAQSREIYLGTSRAERNASPYANTRPDPRLGRGQRAEFEAERLIADAHGDLSRGRPLEARRLLEIVIERYPDTAGADEARRMLAPIYSADPRAPRPGSLHPGATDRATDERGPVSPSARLPAGRPIPPNPNPEPARDAGPKRVEAPRGEPAPPSQESAPGSAWSTEIRRVRALDQDFRASVGDRVFFGDASAELGSKARTVLAAQSVWLKRHPEVPVTIDSHADDRGSPDLNGDMAARRGAAVKARLIEEGVDPARIRVLAHGRDRPVAPCPDPACAAQNRRVVTQIGEPTEATPIRQGTAPGLGTNPRASLDPPRRN